jgi:2-oxoglutarate dehydrogenase E2 component (dihydrolipoamide succinyltransferase)
MDRRTRSNPESEERGLPEVGLAGTTENENLEPGAIEVTMPDTDSTRPARVIAWLKQPGEPVAADDSLCRVYFEGQQAEVASPVGGVLRMLAVGPGSAAPTGTTLAVIDRVQGTRPSDLESSLPGTRIPSGPT